MRAAKKTSELHTEYNATMEQQYLSAANNIQIKFYKFKGVQPTPYIQQYLC